MSELAPQAELLRSLGKLVRGLSALFWGLPITLLICVKTATNEWLRPLGGLLPVAATAVLCYGLWQLGHFRKQERVWTRALDRAKLLSIVILGLSPFLFWWNKLPYVPLYSMSMSLLMITGLLFLFNLNHVLQRLAAMLPDETLRLETHWFTGVNWGLIITIATGSALYLTLQEIDNLPIWLIQVLQMVEPLRVILLTFLVLLPLALTMALIWKVKEVILHSVFTPQD